MKRGDLVLYEGSHWVVQLYDAKRLRVALLLKADGTTQEVPHNLDQDETVLKVIGNPPTEWPFITVPEKPRWGQVTTVSRVERSGLKPLEPFADWILSDPLRSGGSLFLRPTLGLRMGDIIQVAFTKAGSVVNVQITAGFGTVAARQARATVPKPARPSTTYDRLLNEDEFDDK